MELHSETQQVLSANTGTYIAEMGQVNYELILEKLRYSASDNLWYLLDYPPAK